MKEIQLFYAIATITMLSIVWANIIITAMCDFILEFITKTIFKNEYEKE